jgi:hypothetical protein
MIKIKSFLFLIFTFVAHSTFAQGNYGGGVDNQNLHFGFGFQYISSEYKIIKNVNWEAPYFEDGKQVTQGLKSIRSIQNPGFGIGFVSNLYVAPNVDLRFTPVFIFADRIIDYEFNDGASYDRADTESPKGYTRRIVSSTMFEFPVGIKIKSDRRNNFRAYVLAGGKYGIDIAAKKVPEDQGEIAINRLMKNNKTILSYEAGIGFDFYFEFFKLSPEFKFSNSLNSILKREEHPYTSPIDKLFLRNFVFSLYFE